MPRITLTNEEAKKIEAALDDAASFFEMFKENPSDDRRGRKIARALKTLQARMG